MKKMTDRFVFCYIVWLVITIIVLFCVIFGNEHVKYAARFFGWMANATLVSALFVTWVSEEKSI